MQKAVVTGVANAAEKATNSGLQKLNFLPKTAPSPVKSFISTGSKRPREKLLPPGSKRLINQLVHKKGKQRKIGRGIILE